MGFLDRLLGREDQNAQRQQQWAQQNQYNPNAGQSTRRLDNRSPQEITDQQAVDRYRYLLRTAPPETIEQAHAEAFAQLSPQQRQMVLQQLSAALPENERNSSTYANDDPQTLARMATRAEMRQPGTLERTWNSPGLMGGGIGLGGMMAGSFLSTIAGVMVGSAIANTFFDNSGFNDGGSYNDAGYDANAGDGGYDGQEVSDSGDYGNDSGYDSGGSFGDGGGDFGGGDFGGGDFGGGDF